ncbi:MAG: FecR domain-containing protein [Rhodospirillales bacterium]|nr:FecR domain-containing protein [Rhodospirillales bacterium]
MTRSSQERSRFATALLVPAFLVLALVAGAPPVVAAEPAVGRVVQQEGEARAQSDGHIRPLGLGAAVFSRDRIETGEGGRLKIEFADHSLIVLGSDTHVFVADYAVSGSDRRIGAILSLLSGIIRAVVAAPGGHFDVSSQAAVASARSTEWLMEADGGKSAIFAAAGSVFVQSVGTNSLVLLQPGEGTDVALDRSPTAPKAWGKARVESFRARVSLAGE